MNVFSEQISSACFHIAWTINLVNWLMWISHLALTRRHPVTIYCWRKSKKLPYIFAAELFLVHFLVNQWIGHANFAKFVSLVSLTSTTQIYQARTNIANIKKILKIFDITQHNIMLCYSPWLMFSAAVIQDQIFPYSLSRFSIMNIIYWKKKTKVSFQEAPKSNLHHSIKSIRTLGCFFLSSLSLSLSLGVPRSAVIRNTMHDYLVKDGNGSKQAEFPTHKHQIWLWKMNGLVRWLSAIVFVCVHKSFPVASQLWHLELEQSQAPVGANCNVEELR